MIEVKNKLKSPIQLLVRSRKAPRAFTTLILPGVGGGKNVRMIEDEVSTIWVDRLEKMGLITTRYVPNELRKGD